jgi:hypothetical protein
LRTLIGALSSTTAPHGELRLDWYTYLADKDQIEQRMKRSGHLGRNGDTAARQRQDHRVLILICCERLSQFPTGFRAILE